MRAKLRSLWRYRPRALTIALVCFIATLLVLSNLSFDVVTDEDRFDLSYSSYGWPIIWHRTVSSNWGGSGFQVVGWYYSSSRLAGNSAIWLVMLIAPAVACEWLLRRYRLRLRWSLRTMLVAVALVATACGWYANARNRANLQDAIIHDVKSKWRGQALVERWGPKWLDLVGTDHLRRHIVFVDRKLDVDDHYDVRLFNRLSRLPSLRGLSIEAERLTPAMADALGGMKALRTLSLSVDRLTPDVAGAISDLPTLEVLGLSVQRLTPDVAEAIRSLPQLRGLSIGHAETLAEADARPVSRECLAAIGNLRRLEALDLSRMTVIVESLTCLADLKKLKWLSVGQKLFWEEETFASAGLAKLTPLDSLEVLTIDGDIVAPAGLETLVALKRLRALHLGRRPSRTGKRWTTLLLDDGRTVHVHDLEGFRRAFDSLRRSHPEIVIDGDDSVYMSDILGQDVDSQNYDSYPTHQTTWLPGGDDKWMTPSELAEFEAAGGAASFDGATTPPNYDGSVVTVRF